MFFSEKILEKYVQKCLFQYQNVFNLMNDNDNNNNNNKVLW